MYWVGVIPAKYLNSLLRCEWSVYPKSATMSVKFGEWSEQVGILGGLHVDAMAVLAAYGSDLVIV